MRLLLDTHLLLWAAAGDDSIPYLGAMPRAAADLIDDPGNALLFSAASLWEVAIKAALGRQDFPIAPRPLRRGLLDHGYEELPITGEHAVALGELPPLHKDPFDRLLIAQAHVEGLLLLTRDHSVSRYPGPIRRV